MLQQFSTKKQKAEQEYRQFVKWGIGKESIWGKVKGQALLGDEDFVDGFIDYLRKHKDVLEIPKSQRYAARPGLEKIFKESILKDRAKRDLAIREAVERHGYTQCGYRKVGQVYFPKRKLPFFCFEKMLAGQTNQSGHKI